MSTRLLVFNVINGIITAVSVAAIVVLLTGWSPLQAQSSGCDPNYQSCVPKPCGCDPEVQSCVPSSGCDRTCQSCLAPKEKEEESPCDAWWGYKCSVLSWFKYINEVF